MKEIFWTQGDITYKLNGGLGSWAKSYERLPIGTTRVINGILMYVYTCYTGRFMKSRSSWCPVDKKYNTPENLRAWVAK